MLGSGEAITVYYLLVAGFRAVLKRSWLGSMLDLPDLVWCRGVLRLTFGGILASLIVVHEQSTLGKTIHIKLIAIRYALLSKVSYSRISRIC